MTIKTITAEILNLMNTAHCTCTDAYLQTQARTQVVITHSVACDSRNWVMALDIEPGTIIDIWGDRVYMERAAQRHIDGRRLWIGDYAVQPTDMFRIAGRFNPFTGTDH